MREQAVEAVVFRAGGVRYRGLADSEGLGTGGDRTLLRRALTAVAAPAG